MRPREAPFDPEPDHVEQERRGTDAQLVFCGYCGDRPTGGRLELSRVCARCNMGLLLRTAANLAPQPTDGFLVVDDLLHVRALSMRGERLLAISETNAVGRHLGELLVPADAARDGASLHAVVVSAMLDGHDRGHALSIAVRPRGEHGVRYVARVSHCAPGPAALIVLGDLA